MARALGKFESTLWLAAAYGSALAVGVLVQTRVEGAPLEGLLWSVATALVVVFAFGVAFDDASFSDFFWPLAPPVVAGFWLDVGLDGGADPIRPWLFTYFVCLWSVRLTYHRWRGWSGLGQEDWRHREVRRRSGRAYWPVSLVIEHVFPALVITLATLPLWPVMTSSHPLAWRDGLLLLLVVGAIGLEALADHQLFHFRKSTWGRLGILDRGLWAYSRHPNYFGEVFFWTALWMAGLYADSGFWWTLLGPLMVTARFWLVTIPRSEAHLSSRRPRYRSRTQSVSGFVPWPREEDDL